jgi:hypothetical protein
MSEEHDHYPAESRSETVVDYVPPLAPPMDEPAPPLEAGPTTPPPVDPATFPAHLLAVIESMHAALEGIGIAVHWRQALAHLKNARAALEAVALPPSGIGLSWKGNSSQNLSDNTPPPAVDTGK